MLMPDITCWLCIVFQICHVNSFYIGLAEITLCEWTESINAFLLADDSISEEMVAHKMNVIAQRVNA